MINPFITMGGKTLRLTVTLQAGHSAMIYTERGRKSVRVDGTEAFVFHRDSEFFSLPTGESLIIVSAERGAEYLTGELQFRERFLSI